MYEFIFSAWTGHTLSLGAILAAVFSFAPAAATMISIIWFLIQINESQTYKQWKYNVLLKYRTKKLARIVANEKIQVALLAALDLARHARVDAREVLASAKSDAAVLLVQEATVAAAVAMSAVAPAATPPAS